MCWRRPTSYAAWSATVLAGPLGVVGDQAREDQHAHLRRAERGEQQQAKRREDRDSAQRASPQLASLFFELEAGRVVGLCEPVPVPHDVHGATTLGKASQPPAFWRAGGVDLHLVVSDFAMIVPPAARPRRRAGRSAGPA